MLLVEFYRSSPRFVVALGECAESGLGQNLGAAEVFFDTMLRCLALQVCGPVLEVEDEPELEARIRDGEVEAVPVCKGDGLGEVRMLVTVEHAPDLVVGAPVSLPRAASLGSLRLNCSLDELQRAASIGGPSRPVLGRGTGGAS